MKPDQSERGDLRRKAEEHLSDCGSDSSTYDETKIVDPRALVQELQIHQVELEMQNEELRRSKLETEVALTKYSDLYDFAPLGLFTLDVYKMVHEVNLAGAKLLGTQRGSLLNRRFELFIAPEDRQTFDAFCHEAHITEEKQKCELRLLKSTGERIYAYIEGIAKEKPGIEYRLAIIDITDRKKAEEELQKAHDELEQRVQERTEEISQAKKKLEAINLKLIDEIKEHSRAEAELQIAKGKQESINKELQMEIEEHKQTEKELMESKEAAEAATRAKAEFLANMSHEIRTPMNAVIGMTSLLIDERLTPEQKDFIETIRTNGEALMVIINDILDFSKMEDDKVVLEEQPFELRQCVEEALDLVTIKASEKKLNLAYTIDKNVPDTIIGDPSRLRQILGNLLSNAVKFTDIGEVKVSVSSNQDINELHFAVQDTGIGISQDKMDRLFQSFSQADTSTTRLYGGTGLGLAISKKLVEMMDGRIWVESEPGKGSTFHFTIHAELANCEPKTSLKGVQLPFSGKRVLIVDDNKTNRRILVKQAYDWGMMPMTATSGQEALGWIQRGNDFDIAILNLNMPDMDGVDMGKEIRKYNEALPIVILTSIGQRVPSNHAYLVKPIKPSHLYDVLMEVFSRQPIQEKIQAPSDNQSPAVNKAQNRSLRILLAEDNVSSQKVTVGMLKKLGYTADYVANGVEALQALERQHYDIVLMDLQMPVMDGLEATRLIRQRWPDNGLKIIAITAYALKGDREKCIEAGMNDYIAKPVRIEDLERALKDIERL